MLPVAVAQVCKGLQWRHLHWRHVSRALLQQVEWSTTHSHQTSAAATHTHSSLSSRSAAYALVLGVAV